MIGLEICPWAVDKESWFALGNAQLVSGFLELYSRFHKKKLSDPGFHEQKFPGSRIRIIL